jgi:hypothetical protein
VTECWDRREVADKSAGRRIEEHRAVSKFLQVLIS